MEARLRETKPLLQYLLDLYNQAKIGAPPPETSKWYALYKAGTAELESFLAFAQEHLDTNMPVGYMYLERGMGLTLANGQGVSLAIGKLPEPMRDEGIPVTRPKSAYGQGGMVNQGGVALATNPPNTGP